MVQMSNMENSTATTPAQSEGSMQDLSQQSGGNVGPSSSSSQPPAHQGSLNFFFNFYKVNFFIVILEKICLFLLLSTYVFFFPEIPPSVSLSNSLLVTLISLYKIHMQQLKNNNLCVFI